MYRNREEREKGREGVKVKGEMERSRTPGHGI